jgi:nitrite reductase (NADH) large subunit
MLSVDACDQRGPERETDAKLRLVMVGNGMAGMRTLEELLKLNSARYAITVFGAEPHGNYNRIMLSPVLAGEKAFADIMLNDHDWYTRQGITLRAGCSVVGIDREQKAVMAADGTRTPYDHLLLATGSDPFMLPIPGIDLSGVISFRDIGDVDAMLAAATRGGHAVVIGGGLLGLEAANGLLKRGMRVTVVHLFETLMERQLDAEAAALLRGELERAGLEFLLGQQTAALLGEREVSGVRFRDGSTIACDLVVMAVGIRPNTRLAVAAGLACERGVLVDDRMQTSDPAIYAVGECVQHRGQTYGLVAPLYEQARVCARQLAGADDAIYHGSITSTRLKVTGIDVFSAGDFNGDGASQAIVYRDPSGGIYKKLVIKDDRITGAVLYGDTADGAWYMKLMQEGTSIAALRSSLLFGPASAAA